MNPRFVVLAFLAVTVCACVSPNLAPHPSTFSPAHHHPASVNAADNLTLRMLSINLAHGRGDGVHQAFQDEQDARRNLDAVEALIRRQSPDVIGLQEADAPSKWSGNFDHVEYIAEAAEFKWGMHTAHARGLGLSYGTAVISRLPIEDHAAYTFRPAPASLPKGFSLAIVRWPGKGIEIDVVSVHMEPLRESIRQRQAIELVAALADRKRPLVMMGDFNTEWDDDDGVLRKIVNGLNLTAHAPLQEDLVTFPKLDRRLDWILVSSEFRFVDFDVLDDPVSDHLAIVADLALTMDGEEGRLAGSGRHADGGG
jgi:endonuclease/exonuclease/phosphatase family metal-dependent hydrolase